MGRFTLAVDNLFALRSLRWSPEGVNLLVGANGSGKTTVLLALKLLRAALDRGLPEAIRLVFGGSQGMKHRDAIDEDPIEVSISIDELRWWIRLRERGASVDHVTEEGLQDGDREIFRRDGLGGFRFGEQALENDERVGLRAVLDSQIGDPAVSRMAAFLRTITAFHDPDLHGLRRGSDSTHSRFLHSRGHNALTMLRAWHQRRTERHRFRFVLTGMQAAFPGLIHDLDFLEAGNTLVAQVYRPGRETPELLAHEANGVLAMLVLLCDLAAADPGGVVAIDEPANALHPFAIRVFARLAERWARKHQLTVILATHSTVLLDHFDAMPHQVYVLEQGSTTGPTRLDELKNPEWLRQFRLGELYADGELGSNDDRG